MYLCKKHKKCYINSHVGASKIIFFTCSTKNVIFPKNLCTNKWLYVHVVFCFRIFWYFEMCFHTIGSYVSVSWIGFPYRIIPHSYIVTPLRNLQIYHNMWHARCLHVTLNHSMIIHFSNHTWELHVYIKKNITQLKWLSTECYRTQGGSSTSTRTMKYKNFKTPNCPGQRSSTTYRACSTMK
jgi:hypothetical protein